VSLRCPTPSWGWWRLFAEMRRGSVNPSSHPGGLRQNKPKTTTLCSYVLTMAVAMVAAVAINQSSVDGKRSGTSPAPPPAESPSRRPPLLIRRIHIRPCIERLYRGSQAKKNSPVTATPRRWIERDTGQNSVQRGSPRWIVGLTNLLAGILLLVSVFFDWVHIAIGNVVQASVSGAGTVSVTKPDDPQLQGYVAQSLEQAVGHGGLWVAVIGVLIVAAAAAYLWLIPHAEAAIAVAVLGGIGAIFCLSCAFNVQTVFREALDVNYVHYSLGSGVVVACCMTVLLTMLGVAAFVLDCVDAGVDMTRR